MRRLVPVLLLCIMCVSSAHAQIVFDGNVLWNNNDNTLAGQFTGTAGAGAGACTPGLTAFTIGTVNYTHNRLVDPLFSGTPPFVDFQPSASGPAYHPNANFVSVALSDPFFTNVCYDGAVGPNPGDRWWEGWTYFDSLGTGRQDLHLPGMPDPRPLRILDNVSVLTAYTCVADSNYLVRGQLRIKSGASLTIQAGVVIFGERATLGTIIAERGGKIFAIGTPTNPIITTSDDAPGSQVRGGWGGIWMLGRAICNCANTAAGDSCASEGGSIGFFGGNNDADNSGTMEYVRCEYSGFPISPNNELNSFTFDGVGTGTVLDHLQAHRGDDDSFEFFGGVAQCKYIVGTDNNDDGYDWQMGFRGKAQFGIFRLLADGVQTDKGVEADNNEFSFDTTNGPRSNAVVSNFTFIGDRRAGASFPGCTYGVHLRRGTLGTVVNSIVYNFKLQGLRIQDDASFQAACLAGFPAQSIYCAPTVGVPDAPQTGGTLFLSAGPNPMRRDLTIAFTTPTDGRVTVDVFASDGHFVGRIADEILSAGSHSVAWRPSAGTPAGMYFYRVTAGDQSAQGRVIRVSSN